MNSTKNWQARNGARQATIADLLDVCNELATALAGAASRYHPDTEVCTLRGEMRKLLGRVSERLIPGTATYWAGRRQVSGYGLAREVGPRQAESIAAEIERWESADELAARIERGEVNVP